MIYRLFLLHAGHHIIMELEINGYNFTAVSLLIC